MISANHNTPNLLNMLDLLNLIFAGKKIQNLHTKWSAKWEEGKWAIKYQKYLAAISPANKSSSTSAIITLRTAYNSFMRYYIFMWFARWSLFANTYYNLWAPFDIKTRIFIILHRFEIESNRSPFHFWYMYKKFKTTINIRENFIIV